MSYKNYLSSGQSLVEVVVATAVVILLVTGLVSGTTAALKASSNARARSIATKLTQEGMEAVRSKRDTGWDLFNSTYSNSTWCIASDNHLYTGPCTNITVGILNFIRTVTFEDNPGPVVCTSDCKRVTVTVNWTEGSSQRKSTATTYFTKWR